MTLYIVVEKIIRHKMLLGEMARLKMNTFHWHLTDDAGWRLEIPGYPLLTEIGSRRDSTQVADPDLQPPAETGNPAYAEFLRRYQSNQFDAQPHAGYYTKEDIHYCNSLNAIVTGRLVKAIT